ncbi:MAG TPA: sporulation protein [Chloroflexota bacterium]|nr:sporulation protein [Chloroflexota bacterium]
MSACDLEITLDRAEAVYATDDSIVGRICVRTSEAAECQKLTVKLIWRTEGESNQDLGEPVQEQTVFSGRWEAGKRASFPFEVTAPAGPFSYQGRLFQVAWYVKASADLAGMRDAHAERRVQVVPSGSVGRVDFGPKPAFLDDVIGGADARLTSLGLRSRFQRGRWGAVNGCIGVPLFAFLLLALVGSTVASYENIRQGNLTSDTVWGMLMLPMLGLLTLSYGRYLFRPVLARTKVGRVNVQLSSRRLLPGGEVAYTVSCRPGARLELERISVKLAAREEVTIGSGRSSRVRSHQVFEAERTAYGRAIEPGEAATWSGTLRVPDDAPTSFFAEYNELLWALEVTLAVRGWTDWYGRHFVVVGPSEAQPLTVAA